MMGGRLTVNIISSDVPGEELASGPRYRRSTEVMFALRELLDGHAVKFHGDFVDLEIDPPRVRTVSGRSPLFYFGGLSPDARECAAAGADVFLMWPDVTCSMLEVKADMDARAAAKGRSLRYGWRSHVIVRETEDEARAAARRLLSKLDDADRGGDPPEVAGLLVGRRRPPGRPARGRRRRGLRRAPPVDRRRPGPLRRRRRHRR